MPRITRIRNPLRRNRNQGPVTLQSLQSLHRQRNFPALINGVRRFETTPAVPADILGQAYLLVCDLAQQTSRFAEVADYALKTMALDPSSRVYNAAGASLLRVASNFEQVPEEIQNRIRGRVSSFVGQRLQNETLERLDPEQKRIWLLNIHLLFPENFLREQLYLADEVFQQSTNAALKQDATSMYLLAARRSKRTNGKVEPRKVREKAEYVLDNLPDNVKNVWGEEVFHTFIIDLGCFELWDLQERALAIRQPKEDDPIWLYMRLIRKLQESVEAAHGELPNIFPLKSKYNATLQSELYILFARISRDYLERRKKSVEEVCAPPKPESWFERVLLQPASSQAAIIRRIKDMRAAVFQRLGDTIGKRAHLYLASAYPAHSGIAGGMAFLSRLPHLDSVELFLIDAADDRPFKMAYRISRDHEGSFRSVSADSVFEGVNPGRRAQVPLLWEYFSLLAIFSSGLVEKDKMHKVHRREFDQLDAEIKVAAYQLFLTENQAGFVKLEEAFSRVPEYEALLVDLENRRTLSQRIFERFVPAVESSVYALDPLDLLYPLVAEIRIVAPAQLRETLRTSLYLSSTEVFSLLGRVTQKLPFGVVIKTRTGEEIVGIMRDAERFEIFGVEGQTKGLLNRYLATTALEAAVKLYATYVEKRRHQPEVRSGYILDPEGNLNVSPLASSMGLQVLTDIYRGEFEKQLQAQGLLAFPWYCYEPMAKKEGLFHPLPDQTPAGKRRALEEQGTSRLFIQVEPFGAASRLPVRLKKVDKKLVPAPFERNPLRERQQELLADAQPLPDYYGLYIVTTFSDGTYHIYLYALRKTQEEILSDELLAKVEETIQTGSFRIPAELLRHTPKAKRENLQHRLEAGKVSIKGQSAEVFQLQTTFRRPQLVKISNLLQQGIPLER